MNETCIKRTPENTSLMSDLERCPLNAEDDTRLRMVFLPSSGCVDTGSNTAFLARTLEKERLFSRAARAWLLTINGALPGRLHNLKIVYNIVKRKERNILKEFKLLKTV